MAEQTGEARPVPAAQPQSQTAPVIRNDRPAPAAVPASVRNDRPAAQERKPQRKEPRKRSAKEEREVIFLKAGALPINH